ncbi:GNAT family N-acetyltransferase [Aquimarina sp. 2201CG5-10]|uniref:GNAT family N-acetyltransferase n=1 Tax=Aquimarina callyspongiae TaxID=3098150 RepID=UPI002AB4AB28|nr:GNAT family N-acetyltransferase [Aquimarina sp. 2201CG5-10]MDY8138641.1 GNAT family N-acetyltransferase [Aquimarina sp. 2201CG5-10]
MSYRFLPIQTDQTSIKQITNLLKVTFPNTEKYTEEFVAWQYVDNPIGKMVGYNAFLDDELAAHYALMPIKAKIFGKEEKGLLSLNTATHPDHRGKRLFTSLADKSYQLAADQGFGFVIGVANAQSTPGFLKKLDFQLVGMLEAKLGWGKIARKEADQNVDYQRIWNEDSIKWRLSNPELLYKVKDNRVSSSTDRFGIQAILKDFDQEYTIDNNKLGLGFKPIKLWIGIDDTINWKKSFYYDIPLKMRPSPLNLIFKDLTKEDRKFEFTGVRFSALDFDAY